MNRFVSYCWAVVLLALFSCNREEASAPVQMGTVSIHYRAAGLEQTKAVTPGDGRAQDGGGFSSYNMSFSAPAEGTLSLWVSSVDGTAHDICIMEGSVRHTESSGTGTTEPDPDPNIVITHVHQGVVSIFPDGGVSRIYKIAYTYSGGTLSWDFGDADFKTAFDAAALGLSATGVTPPTVGVASTWAISIKGLAIWSKGTSTWDYSNGFFEWGGAYQASEWTNDLVILIADDSDGAIVATYPSSGRVGVKVGALTPTNAQEGVISFSAIDGGNYTVYAFGNTSGLWDMTVDDVNTISDLTTLDNASKVEALHFKAQSRNTVGWENVAAYEATTSPKYDDGAELKNGRLPMSAKSSLKVSNNHNGDAYLELTRCVAKITAKIINNTGSTMALYDYKHTVHGINPSIGWVIPHAEDVYSPCTIGNLLANPSLKYHDLYPALYPTTDDVPPIPIAEDGSDEYDWFVFPSIGPYTVCLAFTLFRDAPEERRKYRYTELPVTNWKAENILSLGRNQHLIVETRISKGLTVSFNFQVQPWTEKSASVEFD